LVKGFRVSRIQGFGIGVYGLELRIEGLGFRV